MAVWDGIALNHSQDMLYRLSRQQTISTSTLTLSIKTVKHSMLPNASQSIVDDQRWRDSATVSLSDIPSRILTVDSNYCVIDKPFGVRMDGDFDITVEKLMLHWLPSLNGNVKAMKWVHQLDFATSGALCIALSSPAASLACSAFEQRETSKQYLAVIQGHIDLERYPCLSPSEISAPFELIHGRVQTKLERKLIMDQIWSEDHLMMQKYTEYFNILQELKSTSLNQGTNYAKELAAIKGYHVANTIFERIVNLSLNDFKVNSQKRHLLKRLIKFTRIPVTITNAIDSIPSNKRARADSGDGEDLNESDIIDKQSQLVDIFTMSLNEGFDYNTQYRSTEDAEPFIYRTEANPELIHINIPVAEISEDFRMEPGHIGNPGKTAQTTLEILERGYYLGKPVTKVRLLPRTGRRHQLRVHCLCLGHPIVGDYTYNSYHRGLVDEEVAAGKDRIGETGESSPCADRMMLHAHKLRISVPVGIKKNEILKAMTDKTKPLVDVTAEDPFVFDNGILVPVLPPYHRSLA